MRASLLLVSSALILTGCLTTQENPNYEYSSKYEPNTRTQVAVAAPETRPVTTTHVTYETQAPAPIQTIDVVMEPSPTGTQFATEEVTGTPGYMALVEQPVTVTIHSAATPQAVDYDYSRNLITADVAMAQPEFAPEIRVLPSAGQDYIVQQGDTIYGLSRKSCVGVDVIRAMNAIGGDYAIQIGQTLNLPESRC